ncbi:MAG: branched-chain amino acid aminotransferase [Rhodobacteraceae bacterium]|uniref:Probable branched-chain-amino-acid aminotransferase n=1 Tax=Salipiger profundus TaxID=1229727 RepID=A0A1U7DBB3_9RHOB|nr:MULTISPECIES: aminotransferase class IV [Salipiger]MAB08617.1 branched-chain amino acid aminotransferase [Paracoccaceae bacterium]HCR93612.1 branched-chain amino acid aminotransferase [Oceanicaulis sp.]APX25429.1 branched chain amino acid aminotransferase apoenzyme [Salipiger profundus]MBN9885749.1 aminotransferase class IV [Salipiger abyssi]GGA25355.1 branched-chain amino acid aminotransferase [Salipiger profundus]
MLTEAVKVPLVDTTSPVWFDGTLLPSSEATLHVLTHSLHNGGAVFEGIRAYDGRLFLGKEHFRRLQRSAELLGYTLPWLVDDLQAAAEAVLWAGGLKDAYVRPIAWRGSESVTVSAQGCRIHTAIAAWDWPVETALGDGTGGLRLVLSDWRRPAPDTAPTASKCSGLYMTGTLSRAAAARSGHDDALMLDMAGHVAETTVTNIVLVRNGRLLSPLPTCFLDSLTKRHVFDLARGLGLSVHEGTVSLDDLDAADEVFVTGTSVELRPVVSLDRPGKHSTWPVGRITKALREAFRASTRAHA